MSATLLPRLTGCPCGHLYADECITRTALPVADRAPCDGRCGAFGLPERERYARTIGACPCAVSA